MERKKPLFVVSAPSGAGKTTLVRHFLQHHPEFTVTVSHTSRFPRSGEEEGESYYFVSDHRFEELIKQQYFIEYAKVHNHYYGTSWQEINDKQRQGPVVLEIDVQGAEQIKGRFPGAVLVFILPPSMHVLGFIIKKRAAESQEVRDFRLKNAEQELKKACFFDYCIINDVFEKAIKELTAVLQGEREAEKLAVKKNQAILETLVKEVEQGVRDV